jgi:hypothetical protein
MKVQQAGVVLGSFLAIGLICTTTSCGGAAPAAASPANNSSVVSAITVTVSPSATTVFTSHTAQFSATVTGTANTTVTWTVNGVAGGNQTVGTINDSGLYIAPTLVPIPATVMITATSVASPSSSGNAQVSVATPIVIVLSPEYLTLLPGQTQYFTASVTGPEYSGVAWSVNGVSGGNASVGTLTTTQVNGLSFTGQYIAPTVPPLADPVIVQAISTVDPAAFATAHVTIPRDTQLAQSTPIKLGTSGGNASDVQLMNGTIGGCCSGTLGSLLSRGGNLYILSNNHVLDKSDQGSIGDAIVQPGLGDVNCQVAETATIAHLSQAPSLHGAPNVDAAIAAIVPGAVDTGGTILDLAAPNQPAPPSSTLANSQTAFSTNEPVAKVGRTSGLTCSSIASVAANLIVHYETSCGSTTSFQVVYTNQIVIDGGSFAEPGDSGSLVVTADTARPLGLLYGGNGNSAIVNPIQDVLSALQDPSTGEVPKMVGSVDHAVACPNAGLSSVPSPQTAFTPQLDAKALQRAEAAKAQYESQLMQNFAVSSISIGNSEDDPVQPALVVHVKGALQVPVPHQLGAVRTRVVFDQATSIRAALPQSELARAIQVKARHSTELMSNSKVFGVGVGASKDSPGEAAIVIYIDRDSQLSMPLEMDGARTQIVRTDAFRTSGWGKEVKKICSKPITNSRSAVRTEVGPL